MTFTRSVRALLRIGACRSTLCQVRSCSNQTKSRTKCLKDMLTSPKLDYLMEAHNGLSAKIVEETGFRGIWGSGLSVSAQLGVRDCNEASWTQVCDVLEFMSDAAPNTPILLDADTGYGNFNNARRLVRKLEQIGVAGMCIEDKVFPKSNSLLDNRKQPLADIQEFSLKIKMVLSMANRLINKDYRKLKKSHIKSPACKDTQRDPDFCLVARVEAFIAGYGLEEALTRAQAYMEAGADAILMHSKKSDVSEIEQFMKAWDNQGPVVVVPTKYYRTPTPLLQELGVNAVIWANHNLRSAVSAMQSTASTIYREQSLVNVEDKIAPVNEIFRLQGEDELKAAEEVYLAK